MNEDLYYHGNDYSGVLTGNVSRRHLKIWLGAVSYKVYYIK